MVFGGLGGIPVIGDERYIFAALGDQGVTLDMAGKVPLAAAESQDEALRRSVFIGEGELHEVEVVAAGVGGWIDGGVGVGISRDGKFLKR